MRRGRLFRALEGEAAEEVVEALAVGRSCRIERIVSSGQSSPPAGWYDQDQDEWVVVLEGSAGLEFEQDHELVEMRPGDWVVIPAHVRHRVAWTSQGGPTVWLAVHFDDEAPV